MSVSLACSCGAHFEAEAAPGTTVRCPECDRPLAVPARPTEPVRTSGLALASVVLGLVGLFTVVLTAVALLLGVAALVSIGRQRGRVAGTGYAVLGIVLGAVFTPLSLFAFSRAELFDAVREHVLAGDVERGGPLEVVRPAEGFAVTRPSEKWGVARGRLDDNPNLILAHPGKDAYLEVFYREMNPGQTVQQCRDEVLGWYRNQGQADRMARVSGFQMRHTRALPAQEGMEAEELSFDLRFYGNRLTYVIRTLKRRGDTRLYVLSGWAMGRRFAAAEAEIRRAQDSFRLLERGGRR